MFKLFRQTTLVKKILLFLLTFLFVSISLLGKKPMIAPSFTLDNIKGNEISLSDFENQLIVLDFWATWCVPCKKAMKELDKIQRKYTEQVKIIAISIDKPRAKATATSYLKSNRFSFISLFDPTWRVKRKYNVVNPPRTYIINPQQEIIYQHEGYKRGDENKIEKVIKNWIKTQPATKKSADSLKTQPQDSVSNSELQENIESDTLKRTEENRGELE